MMALNQFLQTHQVDDIIDLAKVLMHYCIDFKYIGKKMYEGQEDWISCIEFSYEGVKYDASHHPSSGDIWITCVVEGKRYVAYCV